MDNFYVDNLTYRQAYNGSEQDDKCYKIKFVINVQQCSQYFLNRLIKKASIIR